MPDGRDAEIRPAAGDFSDGSEKLGRSKAVTNGVAESKAHYKTAARKLGHLQN